MNSGVNPILGEEPFSITPSHLFTLVLEEKRRRDISRHRIMATPMAHPTPCKLMTISIHGPIPCSHRQMSFSERGGRLLQDLVITTLSLALEGFQFPALYPRTQLSAMSSLPVSPFQKK